VGIKHSNVVLINVDGTEGGYKACLGKLPFDKNVDKLNKVSKNELK